MEPMALAYGIQVAHVITYSKEFMVTLLPSKKPIARQMTRLLCMTNAVELLRRINLIAQRTSLTGKQHAHHSIVMLRMFNRNKNLPVLVIPRPIREAYSLLHHQ